MTTTEANPRRFSRNMSEFGKKIYTDAHWALCAELSGRGISYLTEHEIETDIWVDKWKCNKVFSIDIFLTPNLCVEVDGKVHEKPSKAKKDETKERWLLEHGFKVLRFPNKRVWTDIDNVVKEILAA